MYNKKRTEVVQFKPEINFIKSSQTMWVSGGGIVCWTMTYLIQLIAFHRYSCVREKYQHMDGFSPILYIAIWILGHEKYGPKNTFSKIPPQIIETIYKAYVDQKMIPHHMISDVMKKSQRRQKIKSWYILKMHQCKEQQTQSILNSFWSYGRDDIIMTSHREVVH